MKLLLLVIFFLLCFVFFVLVYMYNLFKSELDYYLKRTVGYTKDLKEKQIYMEEARIYGQLVMACKVALFTLVFVLVGILYALGVLYG